MGLVKGQFDAESLGYDWLEFSSTTFQVNGQHAKRSHNNFGQEQLGGLGGVSGRHGPNPYGYNDRQQRQLGSES
jgi:hypothetical protein